MWYVFSLITWIKCKDYIKVIWIVAVKISQTQFYQRQKAIKYGCQFGTIYDLNFRRHYKCSFDLASS